MAEPMQADQRAEATSWAHKAHTYAAWLEWTITILATVAGLVVAASVVRVRASARASGSGETDLLFDLGFPGLIVLGLVTLAHQGSARTDGNSRPQKGLGRSVLSNSC